jgi:hypothetical protein
MYVNGLVLAFILTLASIQLAHLVTDWELWHNHPVRVVLEKVLLGIFVGLFLLNFGSNPMNLDGPQRALFGLTLLSAACLIGYTVWRYDLAEKEKAKETTATPLLSPSPTPSTDSSPSPSAPTEQKKSPSPTVSPAVIPPTETPPLPTPQPKLTRDEIVNGLASRAGNARQLLWIAAYKAGVSTLQEIDSGSRAWQQETASWLKQHLGQYYTLQFNNALLTGKKEYPGEIRLNRESHEYGIRKDIIDRLYTYVLKLEEILKEVEAKES